MPLPRWYLVLGLFLCGAPSNILAESVGCDDSRVQLNPGEKVINVAPTLVDDTTNIQCALDAAVTRGIPVVRLEAAGYFISRLSIENFNGSFQGRTQASTIVNVIDNSVLCADLHDIGLQSSVIKFIKGEPRLRYMTILANTPCRNRNALDAIVHFTGESSQSGDCEFDVIFGAVDRVGIDGTHAAYDIQAAVSATPEGFGCKDKLLGTFKLNRSLISNTTTGVKTSMRSGAQVDINFNEFRDNLTAVHLLDTNQNTTIISNEFFGNNSASDDYYGVLIANESETPPATTRVIVHNNDFNISSSHLQRMSFGVAVRWINSKVSSIVSGNRFVLSGDRTYGMRYRDNSNAHVTSNSFNGSGGRAIAVTASGNVPVSGWTIVANKGLAAFNSVDGADIRLDFYTSDCIVGPGQGATISNDGVNNTVLPQ